MGAPDPAADVARLAETFGDIGVHLESALVDADITANAAGGWDVRMQLTSAAYARMQAAELKQDLVEAVSKAAASSRPRPGRLTVTPGPGGSLTLVRTDDSTVQGRALPPGLPAYRPAGSPMAAKWGATLPDGRPTPNTN
ncbi:MAG TPA: hypothetical protein VNF26_01785 [Candidatus Baltobacterales bacterium]|nr:hypothetical protein [Candidatus Baltobacterales bacterium]